MTSSSACCFLAVFLLLTLLPFMVSCAGGDFSNLADQCVLGRHHIRGKPTPANLSDTSCAAWSAKSCCTSETAKALTDNVTSADGTWYKLNWDHCGEKKLSDKCRAHFIQDLCFYECSPNLGPWIVPAKRSIAANRFKNVPLCKSDCDVWFEDCKDDFTCTDNWSTNFVWEKGVNKCPEGASCRSMKEIFSSSKMFCENIFDYSFKYANDGQPCMKMSFDATGENPNTLVEQNWISELLFQSQNGGGRGQNAVFLLVLAALAIFWFFE